MNFEDLLKLQKNAEDIEELHAQAISEQVLNPRFRTENLLEKAQEAKDCLREQFECRNSYLQEKFHQYHEEFNQQKQKSCVDIFEQHLEDLNQLEIQKSQAFQRQQARSAESLKELAKSARLSDVLAPLRNINAYDSLQETLKNAPKTQEGSFSFLFRVLSRKNENYGYNNGPTWPTNFDNPETLYQLLTGDFNDTYQSDFEPFQKHFIQGKAGSFIFNRSLSFPYSYNGAEGVAPLAAVAAIPLENTTDSEKSVSLSLALSSFNFAGVFLKTDEWTPLFQTTTNLVHSGAISTDFTLAAYQKAMVLLVSTPYFYRESYYMRDRDGGGYWIYNSHALQHLQLSFLNLREVLSCLSH